MVATSMELPELRHGDGPNVLQRSFWLVPRMACALSLSGLLILMSWWLANPLPTSMVAGSKPTSPILAFCSIIGGLALVCGGRSHQSPARRGLGLACSIAVIGISVVLILGKFSMPFHGFSLSMAAFLGAQKRVIETSPVAIISLLCLGLSLLTFFLPRRFMAIREASCVTLAILAWLSLVGFLFASGNQFDIMGAGALSGPDSILMMTFAGVVLFARPREGIISLFNSHGLGGVVARRTLPIAFVLPVLIRLLRVVGETSGVLSADAGVALGLGLVTFVLATQGAVLASRIEKMDRDRDLMMMGLKRAEHELRSANIELSDLVLLDPLTGLLNRRGFDERLSDSTEACNDASAPLSLLMIDLDGFKLYNDTFGHAMGDSLLRVVAEVLLDSSRQGDGVARFGGDEFALLLPNCSANGAKAIADRIVKHMRGTGRHQQSVTVSIGIGTIEPGMTGSLVEMADKRLYQAKRAGKDAAHA